MNHIMDKCYITCLPNVVLYAALLTLINMTNTLFHSCCYSPTLSLDTISLQS